MQFTPVSADCLGRYLEKFLKRPLTLSYTVAKKKNVKL